MSGPGIRRARLRRRLGREDAVVVTHLPTVLYLTGFRGSSGVLASSGRRAALFTDGRYRLQARQEAPGVEVGIAAEPLRAAAAWLRREGPRRVRFEAEGITVRQLGTMRAALGGTPLEPAGEWLSQLRMAKDAGEIARLRASQQLTARVFEEVLTYVRPGVRELDLAAEIEYRMKQHGARAAAFETIVASGWRSALPHGRATPKRLAEKELVVFDLGAILADYHSDMTRTVYLGTPTARVKKVYAAVREALEGARAVVRAGVEAGQVDAAARSRLASRGLAKYFSHGTGHGLGLEIHEEPRLARGVRTRLPAGAVITLEPGVYIPGWGGVRIEDVVAVRRGGAETLTPLGTELICL
jgi:Xaa-Pro aminopeptidase